MNRANNIERSGAKNLKGITRVNVLVQVDLLDELFGANERIQRDIRMAAVELLEKSGLDFSDSSNVPTLEIFTAVRFFKPTIDQSTLFGFRVETSLCENVALRFGETTVEDILNVVSWRHRTELKFVPYNAACDRSTSQALEEVIQQVKSFISEWSELNPSLARFAGNTKDNFQGLIEGVGPVFEKRLNASGITSIQQLAKLTNDEVNILASLFSVTDSSGSVIGTPGEARLKDFREKAKILLAA